jgi:hypothetical protein
MREEEERREGEIGKDGDRESERASTVPFQGEGVVKERRKRSNGGGDTTERKGPGPRWEE